MSVYYERSWSSEHTHRLRLASRRGLQPRGFPFLPYRVTFSGMAATIRPVDVQDNPGVPTGWCYHVSSDCLTATFSFRFSCSRLLLLEYLFQIVWEDPLPFLTDVDGCILIPVHDHSTDRAGIRPVGKLQAVKDMPAEAAGRGGSSQGKGLRPSRGGPGLRPR